MVKHEAFALRRQRERHSPVTDDGELRDRPAPAAVTHEQAERLERLRQGAEALGHLKPHEIRALVLKAEGFSYREICAMTGWSYTKVNRLLTEGRRAFLRRVSGIQRGADCARYEPLLSALADGEASADDLAALRPHMQTCLSCRAALREFRAAPQRVAGVLPPAVLVAAGGGGPLRSLLESALGRAQHKARRWATVCTPQPSWRPARSWRSSPHPPRRWPGAARPIDRFANHRGPPRAAQVEEREPETRAPTEAPPVDTAPALVAPPAEPRPEPTRAPSHPRRLHRPAPAARPSSRARVRAPRPSRLRRRGARRRLARRAREAGGGSGALGERRVRALVVGLCDAGQAARRRRARLHVERSHVRVGRGW